MKLVLKNHFFRRMVMSNFLNNLGSAIYNLVFVIYVAEVYHSKTMLFIANNIMMLPIYFQIFVGFQSDKTKNKSRALLISGYVQALLFIGVAWLTQNATFVTFSLICLINVISDMLALYSSNLRLPLFKRFLGEEELREAFSFNHFVRILSNIGGQFLGVWLLTISHNNYGLVAFLNALTFFLSTVLLIGIFKDYDSLVEKEAQNSQEEPEKSKKQSLKGAWKVLQGAFETVGSGISVKRLLLALTLQFTLAGAENVMFNMYFLSHPIGILSYEQILIALNLVSTAGLVAGDLTPNDWFSRQTYPFLLICNGLLVALFGFLCLLNYQGYFLLVLLFMTGYIFAKSSPKLTSELLIAIPEDYFGQVMGLISTITQLAIPVGGFLLSGLLVWNETATWILYTLIAAVSVLLLSVKKKLAQD